MQLRFVDPKNHKVIYSQLDIGERWENLVKYCLTEILPGLGGDIVAVYGWASTPTGRSQLALMQVHYHFEEVAEPAVEDITPEMAEDPVERTIGDIGELARQAAQLRIDSIPFTIVAV